ncbi:hypothetical protein ACTXT7_006151 [Hymenolepis weldensis]
MEEAAPEEVTFVVDEVTNIVKESIENNVGNSSYVHTKVPQWTSTIVEQILNQLTKLGKPFKYIGRIIRHRTNDLPKANKKRLPVMNKEIRGWAGQICTAQ